LEFAHVCLPVVDVEEPAEFYVEELGFTWLETPGND